MTTENSTLNDYYFQNQIKKYLVQFMAIFSGMQVKSGKNDFNNDDSKLIQVPIIHGSKDRVVAHILADNNPNMPVKLPVMAAHVTAIEMAMDRFKGQGQTHTHTTFQRGDTGPWIAQASFYNESYRVFYDMIIDSYTENGYIVELGNSSNSTGLFNSRFAMIESWLNPPTSSFSIDGVDASVNTDPHVEPTAGSVTLYPKAGWVKFNSADAGSNIAGEYQVLYGFN